jgi:hypothetical protein
MYTVWHVDKYKITCKLIISHWTNETLQHTVVSSGLSRPGIIDRAVARRLRNTGVEEGNVIRVCDRRSNADEERQQCFIFSGTSKIFSVFYCPKNNRHSFNRSNTYICFLL